ncbi:O(6)-methylguanine-induced apoptosis 2 [Chanos chanos]|uniref:O(6)-methylguanine-induced apoptosis 2 n=1 Tax=Chanos chanos TaxID=29144 RepID=A0A6J2WFQ4_CHACN|nr:O(6)-methylguanine-induced apoptosis 2 [Chanos chanos]
MGKINKELSKFHERTASIPSKYQTIVISNNEKKGFFSQTKRFSDSAQNENPGPGSYVSHTAAEMHSPSFSQKGTGFFASQAVRIPRTPRRIIPAPNAYDLQSSLVPKHSFGIGESRNFRQPIALKTENVKNKTPAPNEYNVSYDAVERNTVMSLKSSFLSKSERNPVLTSALRALSPCHYEVRDAVIRKDPKVPFSSFKSGTARIQSPVNNQVPGPGAYSPHQPAPPVNRTILPRGHYLALSAPPLILPKPPPLPGPGHYNIVNYDIPPKQFVSSAAFMSGTSRWTQEPRGPGIPGPGSYNPEVSLKQSFLYNRAKKWIPL